MASARELKGRIRLDTSALDAAIPKADALGSLLAAGFEQATPAATALTKSLGGIAVGVGETLSPVNALGRTLAVTAGGADQLVLALDVADKGLLKTAAAGDTAAAGLTAATRATEGLKAQTAGLVGTTNAATAAQATRTKEGVGLLGILSGLALVDGQQIAKAKESAAAAREAAGAFGEAGKAGEELTGRVSKLGAALGGAGAVGLPAIATVVGIGALYISTKAVLDLTDQVRNYQRVSGTSAEEASRMVYVFNALGVSADDLDRGMFKLSRTIADTPAKLNAVGVSIALTESGSVDLSATLLNVVDAYQSAGSAAERDTIAQTAFGRSGLALIPILARSREELKRLSDQASSTFTQKQLDQAHKFQIELKQLELEFEHAKVNVGEFVLGPLSALVEGFNDAATAEGAYDAVRRRGGSRQEADAAAAAAVKAAKAQRDLSLASIGVAQDAASAGASLRDEAAAADALGQAMDSLVGVQVSVEQANLAVLTSVQAQDDAQKTYNDAVRQYGADSEEARRASLALSSAHLGVESALNNAAKAAVDYANEQAALNGQTLTAAQQDDIYRGKLRELANSLGPSDPLRANLLATLAILDNLARDRESTVTVHTRFLGDGTTRGALSGEGFDEGGRPPVHVASWVGESGKELFVPDVAGRILSHAQSMEVASAAASSSGIGGAGGQPAEAMPSTVHVRIDQPVIFDGREIGRIVEERMATAQAGTFR